MLDAPDGNIVRHKNEDTLDNRKENIILYKDDITNNYEIREEVTAIFLEKVDGSRIETLIDIGDLEKVKKLGYTLHVSKGNGLPYVVGKVNRENVFLHRYIVDAKGELQVDHINHNTLDNRRCNLNIVTRELNQQNRKGARKNSKSGVRGVSWDERNKDWVVVVRGIYFGRFKDLEKAKKLAEEKIEELMPYAINKEI